MSVYDEIGGIKVVKLASDFPDEITATITAIGKDSKKQGIGAGSPVLKIMLDVNGEELTTIFRIPKAWTGKGQLDRLVEAFKKLGYPKIGGELLGKTFLWKRQELEGSVKGNARHYPIKEIATTPKKAK